MDTIVPPDPPDFLNQEPMYAGVMLDAEQRIVLVLAGKSSIGVSVRRLNHWPSIADLCIATEEHPWIAVYRDRSEEIFMRWHSSGGGDERDGSILRTAEERESAQFAVQLGLAAWPHWAPKFRKKYSPRTMIPLRATIASA